MNTQEQRQQARNLYFGTDMTQQQIAEQVNINRKTLYLWIKDGGWRHAKYAGAHAPSLLVDQYYTQLAALNASIAQRTERPWPTKEEVVIIRSLSNTIVKMKKDNYSISATAETLYEFFTHLRIKQKNDSLVLQLVDPMNAYLKSLVEDRDFFNLSTIRNEEQAFEQEYAEWLATQKETPQAETPQAETPSPVAPHPGTPQQGYYPLEGGRGDVVTQNAPAYARLPKTPVGHFTKSQNAVNQQVKPELPGRKSENGALSTGSKLQGRPDRHPWLKIH